MFHLLVSVKVCKNVRTYDVSASSTIKLSLPGTHPVDVQRRKLDQRGGWGNGLLSCCAYSVNKQLLY